MDNAIHCALEYSLATKKISSDDQGPLVQKCCYLLPVGIHLYRRQRRRNRRLSRPQSADGGLHYPGRTWRYRGKVDAVAEPISIPGRRMSSIVADYLRSRPAMTLDARQRFCRIYPRMQPTRHPSIDRSCSQSHIGSTSMVQASSAFGPRLPKYRDWYIWSQ